MYLNVMDTISTERWDDVDSNGVFEIEIGDKLDEICAFSNCNGKIEVFWKKLVMNLIIIINW